MAKAFAAPLKRLVVAAITAAVLGGIGAAHAATETVVYAFGTSPDAGSPVGGLVAHDSTLYGASARGGASGAGTVFSLTTAGTETVLHSFSGGPDGAVPNAGLSVTPDGLLLGTTSSGGGPGCRFGCGTAFTITPAGQKSNLYDFRVIVGETPSSRLVPLNGAFYGLTEDGGTTRLGTVYKLNPLGFGKPLYTFAAGGGQGARPFGDLLVVRNELYGTSLLSGGPGGVGAVFKVTRTGVQTVLHSFTGNEGSQPNGGLVDVGGTLFGVTRYGDVTGYGGVFSIAADGTFALLHSFGSGTDGKYPNGNLLKVGAKLYGTTQLGGTASVGTVFTITLGGEERVAYSFTANTAHSAYPNSGLIEVGGDLYGTTAGGFGTYGAVYKLQP